jgi:G:T-mismatch repair DNA endonuclease (very short patch repair protein)
VIQHAENGGEFVIPGTNYRADGYHAETMRVFEYYGDYWHGNPAKYSRDEMNHMAKKTFGELYDYTMKRENEIEELGYEVVRIWETEFKNKK